MAKPLLAVGALAMAIAVTSLVTGSGQQLPRPSAVKVQWRTPWGDPNLQGNYTNKYEQSTPFERPPEFEGRLLADVAGAEPARRVAHGEGRPRCVRVAVEASVRPRRPEGNSPHGALGERFTCRPTRRIAASSTLASGHAARCPSACPTARAVTPDTRSDGVNTTKYPTKGVLHDPA